MKKMAENEEKNTRLYYSIGEVADQFGVNESLLRFWESEFDIISPRKTAKGTRYYNSTDIDNIRLVYYLVKEKGLTLAGAKKQLKDNKEGVVRKHELIIRLRTVRDELIAVRNELIVKEELTNDTDL